MRITADSFGSRIPENWEEIAEWLNIRIEDGEDAETVWENYCSGRYPDAPKASMISKEQMDIIATYMDDEIRERLHSEMAPCEPEDFLRAYIEEDPELKDILIELDITI